MVYDFQTYVSGEEDSSDYIHLRLNTPITASFTWSPDNLAFVYDSEASIDDYAKEISRAFRTDRIVKVNTPEITPEYFLMDAGTISENEDGTGFWSNGIGVNYDDVYSAEVNDVPMAGIKRYSWSPFGREEDFNAVSFNLDDWQPKYVTALKPRGQDISNEKFRGLLESAGSLLENELEKNGFDDDIFL